MSRGQTDRADFGALIGPHLEAVNVVIVHATSGETDIPGRYPLL